MAYSFTVEIQSQLEEPQVVIRLVDPIKITTVVNGKELVTTREEQLAVSTVPLADATKENIEIAMKKLAVCYEDELQRKKEVAIKTATLMGKAETLKALYSNGIKAIAQADIDAYRVELEINSQALPIEPVVKPI